MLIDLAKIALLAGTVLIAHEVHNQQVSNTLNSTDDKQLTILFAGDIMQHGPQINAAWDDTLNTYNYDPCFQYVAPIVEKYDLAIANLEVTFAGEPFTGYPQFSSPDELATGIKNAGFDVLVTANNHSCDRGDNGIIRTTRILDSLSILRTGTFRDSVDYKMRNPLIIEKNGIKLALLNYTYGTNGLTFTYPAMVNLIDEDKVIADLQYTKSLNPDFIIVCFHWGNEYELNPTDTQRHLAEISRENGADAVIGSHPHVLQPFHYTLNPDSTQRNFLVVYSLGNFVSNQRDRNRDGGAMVGFTLLKTWNKTTITDPKYHLTWVHTPIEKNKKKYYIIPVNMPTAQGTNEYNNHNGAAKTNNTLQMTDQEVIKMTTFINDSRQHLNNSPTAIPEASYEPWIIETEFE
jgi:poly-gamma-glutamate capsule biosynthesis protein CapA/YwtB (metallophosphatase superfamily)